MTDRRAAVSAACVCCAAGNPVGVVHLVVNVASARVIMRLCAVRACSCGFSLSMLHGKSRSQCGHFLIVVHVVVAQVVGVLVAL